MKTKLAMPFLILAGLVILIGLACGLSPASPDNTNNPEDNAALITPELLPTSSPAPQSGDLLYQTVFEDLSDWTITSRNELANYTVESRADGLYITVPLEHDYVSLFYNDLTAEDVRLEANVELTGGSNFTHFALYCRSSERGRYSFNLHAGGLWEIGKLVDDVYTILASGGGTAIHSGKTTNLLAAICQGSDLTLSINGVLVRTVVDYDLTSGQVGLGLLTLQYQRAEGFFHDFSASVP